MSLIQEALRRKDDEPIHPDSAMPPRVIPQARGDVPPVLKIPEKRQADRSSSAWMGVVIALVVVLALIVGALALIVYSARQMVQTAGIPASEEPARPFPPPEATTPAMVSLPPASPSRSAELVVVREEPKPAAPEKPVVVEPALAMDRAPAARTPEVAARPQPQQPVAKPAKPPVVTAVPKKPLEGVKTVPAAMSASSSWPRLTLHGVMAQASPTQGSAMINGIVVEVGERIEGSRLLEVHRNGILIEYGGETQFVRVGQSTY